MFAEKLNANSSKTAEYVVNHLCNDTKTEVIKIFGNDYKFQILKEISRTEAYAIKLKDTSEPVGLFGLIELNENAAGIYLLTTDNLHKGNIITFLKGAKKQVDKWAKDYKLILDNCYKQNETIKKWLKLLKFKPSNYQDDDFQIYYRGKIELYKDIQ